MQQGINIEEVKKYNASLREYKDKSSKLRAEIEFNEQELKRQCDELSKTLGIQVTPENVESILNEKIAKINNTMEVGNEILKRIKAEESTMVNANAAGVNVNANANAGQPVTRTAPVSAPNFGFAQAAPGTAPVTAPVTAPNIPDISGGLPPIFANGQGSISI